MSGLKFAAPDYDEFSATLLADRSRESCGILHTRAIGDGRTWLVTATEAAPEAAYERRDAVSAILKPAFLVEVANRARRDGTGVVLCHTHPLAAGPPAFSLIDDSGEVALTEYFSRRASHGTHLALVIGPSGCRARVLGTPEELPVWQIGRKVRSLFSLDSDFDFSAHFDRQARAFGTEGQKLIGKLRIAIVGLGGTGSVVAQQLAYLGAKDFLLLDPDEVEITNLNRVVGASSSDVGHTKVEIARRSILAVQPDAKVEAIEGDVIDADIAPNLTSRDFIFICTDTHASRAVVAQIAYQYLVPTIDMGVSITVKEGKVSHISGRVQMLAPELPCLLCTQALDSELIRREILTPEQRAADPYVQGIHEPQPAVISLNTSMTGLAVTMFLGAVTSVPAEARFQMYDGVRGTVRIATATCAPSCIVCSSEGALAKGESWALPLRPSRSRDG